MATVTKKTAKAKTASGTTSKAANAAATLDNFNIYTHLQTNFGFETFKGLQEQAINSLRNNCKSADCADEKPG